VRASHTNKDEDTTDIIRSQKTDYTGNINNTYKDSQSNTQKWKMEGLTGGCSFAPEEKPVVGTTTVTRGITCVKNPVTNHS
jgi:hypothetical protein